MHLVVLFDGDCHFCHRSVQFIIKRDRKEQFYFCSLQSDKGQELLEEYGVPKDIESLVLIEKGAAYVKSTAALRICRHLHFGWKCLVLFQFVPRRIRDAVYDVFAKNRYKWFAKKSTCFIPEERIRRRFLH